MVVFLLFVALIVGLGLILHRQMNQYNDEVLDTDFRENDINRSQKTPDKLLPFGQKMQWIAVKADYREQVATTLGLTNLELANWSHGLEKASDNHVFLTPSIEGWVLAVGWGLGDIWTKTDVLENLSREYAEAQFFHTHSGTQSHTYIRYANGKMIRNFHCEEGEVLMNEGTPSNPEKSLNFSDLLPDDNTVLNIAAEWSINPSLLDENRYSKIEGQGTIGYLRP